MAVTRSAAKKTVTAPVRENPLNLFVWEGTDKRGVKMKGEQQSKNANFLRAELRKQGITPSVVKVKPKPLFGSAGKPVSAKDIAFFSRQMATMMKAGVPMVSSLEIIESGQKNVRMKKMVEQIRFDIEGALRCMRPSASIPCSSTSSIATWCVRARALVCLRPSWRPSPTTKKTSKR